MNYRFEIKLLKKPPVVSGFSFIFTVDGTNLLSVAKTFGTVAAENVIVAGANTDTAAAAVLANLNAYEAVTGVTYTLSGTSVYVDIEYDGYGVPQEFSGTLDYVSVYAQDPEVMGNALINTYKFSIEVIDTYENDRVLIEEFTQVSGCKLKWDGGEDLYQPMMPSVFSFNMLVKDKADGKFLHLLTGDEKRYLVKVRNHDTHNVNTLLWQGYILPDLYDEPWQGGVFFVSFSATDMIASLKGKKFDPWYYQQIFTLPDLFGMILRETGLQQEMYVRPALVNVSNPDYRWRDMNISMRQFTDGKKYDDLYTILEAVLKAQGMTIYSYRGKWYFDGMTRRAENTAVISRAPVAEVYHPDGVFKQTIKLSREVVAPDYSNGSVNITAEIPWKTVNVDFEADFEEGVFPETIVNSDYYATRYRYDSDFHDYTNGYITGYNYGWKKINFNYDWLTWSDSKTPFFWYKVANVLYNENEAFALNNYFEYESDAYVVTGRRYKLEIEIDVDLHYFFAIDPGAFADALNGSLFQRLVMFQMLLNGNEILSNRPGATVSKLVQFVKTSSSPKYYTGATNAASFKLDFEFVVSQSGPLVFRFLAPAVDLNDMFVDAFAVYPKIVKVSLAKDASQIESATATRPGSRTLELDYAIGVSCVVDSSIKNSFGIAKRISDHFVKIPVALSDNFNDTHYASLNLGPFEPIPDGFSGTHTDAAYIELFAWPISPYFRDIIFKVDLRRSLFLIKPDGSEVPYYAVYVQEKSGTIKMAAYTSYIPAPPGFSELRLPEGYNPLPLAGPGTQLMLMISAYQIEDKSERAKWKIFGFPDDSAETYVKTVAKACHAVRPDTCFKADATALGFIWPTQLSVLPYRGENKKFIPVRLEVDLTDGKTNVTMTEAKLQNLTDITYE